MENPSTLEEAQKEIQRLVAEANAALERATGLSKQFTTGFYFSGNEVWGMGGYCENGEWEASSNSC